MTSTQPSQPTPSEIPKQIGVGSPDTVKPSLANKAVEVKPKAGKKGIEIVGKEVAKYDEFASGDLKKRIFESITGINGDTTLGIG